MKILAPAKINLFLEVTGRRKDGYHNIVSLMAPVSLYDKIIIKKRINEDIRLRCNIKNLAVDDTNLVMKAAKALKNELKINKGVDIYLEKKIPMGAGLGGGSSDAAAVLKGLLKVWKKRLPEKRLLALAKSLGADVPFFLSSKPAVARGIGEKLESVKNMAQAYILLVNPGFGVPTKQVYKKLSFPLTKNQKINRIRGLLKAGMPPQDWGKLMFNRLEEAVLPDHPEIGHIKGVLSANGFSSLMSGSGSTVFGVVSRRKDAERVVPELSKRGWQSWIVKTIA